MDGQAVREAIEAGKALAAQFGKRLELGERFRPFMILPQEDGRCEVYDLEQFRRAAPPGIARTVTFLDVASFLAYLGDFEDTARGRGRVYFDPVDARFEAVLDDHALGAPAWGEHRARLALEPTDSWRVWRDGNNVDFAQQMFAELIDHQAHEIVDPDAATFATIAQRLDVRRTTHFVSGTRLSDGQVNIVFSEENVPGEKSVKIPARFAVEVTPYVNGPAFRFEAAFRYSVPRDPQEGLRMRYTILQLDKFIEAANAAYVAQIREGTQMPVLWGRIDA